MNVLSVCLSVCCEGDRSVHVCSRLFLALPVVHIRSAHSVCVNPSPQDAGAVLDAGECVDSRRSCNHVDLLCHGPASSV